MYKNSREGMPRWVIAAALAAALLALLAGGTWFYGSETQHDQKLASEKLLSTARLKSNQIATWRSERLGDAHMLQESPFLATPVALYFANANEKHKERLLQLFRSLQRHYSYADILLVDTEGRVQLSLSGARKAQDCYQEALAGALRTDKPVITNLHKGRQHSAAHISIVAPLFLDQGQKRSPLGAIVLVSDASQFLQPLLKSSPTPNKSAETYLVSREGNEVVFLHELRHHPAAPSELRLPLHRRDIPAVMAVLGKQGVVQGSDYRGIETMAAILPVPDSPWFMVAQVDAAELFAQSRSRLILSLLFFLTVLSSVVGIGLAAWHRRKKK